MKDILNIKGFNIITNISNKGKIILSSPFNNEPNIDSLLEDDDRLFNAVILKFDDYTFKPLGIESLYIIKKKGE